MKYRYLLEQLSTAPATAIEPTIVLRLKKLAAQDAVKSDEMLDIIDDCVFGSLASNFSIQVMDILWKRMLNDEGVTIEQAMANAQPRRDTKLASM